LRRTFSTLAVLSLLALGLSLPFTPASASDDDTNSDQVEHVDHHDDQGHDGVDDDPAGDDHHDDECDTNATADVWNWADSHHWTWDHSGHTGFGYWLGFVLQHRDRSDDHDCASPDIPEVPVPDDPEPPVVIPPVIPDPPVTPPDTPEPPQTEHTQPPEVTPEQPSEPPDLAPTDPPKDPSVGGAIETNPGDEATPPEIESPTTDQPASRPPVIHRAPVAIPRVSVSVDCSARVLTTELSNVGDAPGLVDVFLVTESVRPGIAIAAGAVVNLDFPVPEVAEGENLSVIVTDDDGVVAAAEATVDCESPADVEASTVVSCQANAIFLTLSNRGEETASIDVLVERSGRVATVDLAGGQNQTVEVDTTGRSSVPLRVVADGEDILRSEIEINCAQPVIEQPEIESSASVSCVTGEVLVIVWNRGAAAGIVAISNGESSLTDISVAAGSVIVAGLPLARSQTTANVSLTDAGGAELARHAISNPCGSAGSADIPPCSSVVVSKVDGSMPALISTPSPGESWWVDAGSVSAPGAGESGLSAARTCADPSADFIADCGSGSLQVVLSNGGSISTRLAVLIDGDPTGSTVDVSPGETITVDLEISDASRVAAVEAGRVEPLTTLEIDCGSGRAAPRTAYAVFAFSIGGSLLAMVGDPRKLWFLLK